MKKAIRIITILIIFILIFTFLNILLKPKYAETLVEGNMIKEYYKEPKDHEVIFIGDCEVYANFSPMVMYEEAGIKAYVRGTSQQMIWQSYYILKETLNYEIPKVVVLNVNAMRYGKDSDKVSEAYNRLTIDNMKWSKEKIEIIKESMTEEETFLSYVFPILRYHSRYDKLTKEDFEYLFKSKTNNLKELTKEITSFFSCRIFTEIISILMMNAAVWFSINDILMKVVSNIVVIILNFVFSKIWIFKGNKNQSTKETRS